MKKWIILIIVIAAVAAAIYMQMKWQTITVLLATLGAPFKYISGLLGEKEEDIKKEHAAIRKHETKYQQELEIKASKKEESIKSIESQISELDEQLAEIEKKKTSIDKKVNNMSLQELQLAGRNYFGD